MGMITPLHGFSMALADSVPGVSGGTVAFILGFYDKFIGALHDLFSRDRAARRRALGYLLRLGIGWAAGMGLCVSLLASLFSVHIYFMSSLFLGLTVASIPFVALAEKNALRRWQFFPFALVGAALVAGLTMLRSGSGLQKYRPAMIWLILGLMLGSLYAICMGPASLQSPQPPLSAASFRPMAFLLGAALLVGLELLRRRTERSVAA